MVINVIRLWAERWEGGRIDRIDAIAIGGSIGIYYNNNIII